MLFFHTGCYKKLFPLEIQGLAAFPEKIPGILHVPEFRMGEVQNDFGFGPFCFTKNHNTGR